MSFHWSARLNEPQPEYIILWIYIITLLEAILSGDYLFVYNVSYWSDLVAPGSDVVVLLASLLYNHADNIRYWWLSMGEH